MASTFTNLLYHVIFSTKNRITNGGVIRRISWNSCGDMTSNLTNDLFGVDRRRALSPLRGFAAWRNRFRGLTPTAKLFRRYAAGFAARFVWGYNHRMARKLQFSLRWMFAAVAVVALITAEAAAFPHNIAMAIGTVLSVVFPAALVAAIVYARGSVQAFFIGALVAFLAASTGMLSATGFNLPTSGPPLSTAFYSMIPSSFLSRLGSSVGVEFSLRWIIAIAGGLMAVAVRWMAAGGGNAQPRSGERV
ncbi:MAG TPA: hypothetical protein VF278_21180 [Pirellulales bacterium]